MRKLLCSALLSSLAASPALADGTDEDVAPAADIKWSLSASGGATAYDGDGEQPFVRFGVTRFIGQGYVRASVTHFSTRQGAGIAGAVPAKTLQVSLAGGYTAGRVGIDAYASLGWRRFSREAYLRDTGQTVTIDSDGKTAAGGISLSYQLDLNEKTVLTPFVAGDINRVDIARVITVGSRGTVTQNEKQTGETGSLGFTLDRFVGAKGHRIGLYGAAVATSNSAVAVRSSVPNAAVALFGPQDLPGAKDSWGEYGASATFKISRAVLLDLSAVRTAGYRGGESTSFSGGLRLRF